MYNKLGETERSGAVVTDDPAAAVTLCGGGTCAEIVVEALTDIVLDPPPGSDMADTALWVVVELTKTTEEDGLESGKLGPVTVLNTTGSG